MLTIGRRGGGDGRQKYPPSPKPATHPTIKKLGAVIPYFNKIQKYA